MALNIQTVLHKILARKMHFDPPAVNIQCSEFEVNNWTLSDFILEQIVPAIGIRPYPLNELLLMAGGVCRFKPDHIFEWGTHLGVSARIFYETKKACGFGTVIHTIDLPDDAQHVEHPGNEHARLIKHIPEINIYRGDGLETASRIAAELPPHSRLLFFLDGDHSYESVLRELSEISFRFPAACIILHDTFYQEPSSGYNIGPYLAIRKVLEKCAEKYQIIETKTGLPGMTLLYPVTKTG